MSSLIRRSVLLPLTVVALALGAAGTAIAGTPNATVSVYNDDGSPAGGTVCDFFFEFNKVAGGETGSWALHDSTNAVVEHGDYSVTVSTGDRKPATGTFSLADGTYTLLWDDEPIDSSRSELRIVVNCASPETAAPSATPEQSVAGATSVATFKPTQNVAGLTNVPELTLPTTTTDAPVSAETIPWAGLLVPALAGLLALMLVTTMRRSRARRR